MTQNELIPYLRKELKAIREKYPTSSTAQLSEADRKLATVLANVLYANHQLWPAEIMWAGHHNIKFE